MNKDDVEMTEKLEVEIVRHPVGATYYSCPVCGSAMKEDQVKGWRICANKRCRERAEETTLIAKPVYDVRYPCPVCGKETKEHHEQTRICSSKSCRNIVPKVDFGKYWPDLA